MRKGLGTILTAVVMTACMALPVGAAELRAKITTDVNGSACYQSEWDQYGSYYIYNQLGAEEKRLWDDLYAICDEAMSCLTDYSKISEDNRWYCLPEVTSPLITSKEVCDEIFLRFRYANPQYFFLANDCTCDAVQNSMVLYLYPEMHLARDRRLAKEDLARDIREYKSLMDSRVEELAVCMDPELPIAGLPEDARTVLAITQVLCENTEQSAQEDTSNELRNDTQNIYGVFEHGIGGCEGYTLATVLMCNAYQIDCIGVPTRQDYAFNKVRVSGFWYNLDVYKADTSLSDENLNERFLLRSDLGMLEEDRILEIEEDTHTPLASFLSYMPNCPMDTIMSVQEPVDAAIAPVLNIVPAKDGYEITITSETQGATIYYILDEDGYTPSCAATKSCLYTGPFVLPSAQTTELQAVAVKDGYKDSDVSREILRATYQLTLHPNGGEGEMGPYTLYANTDYELPMNAYVREGYEFVGWNTTEAGDGTAYDERVRIHHENQNLTLYAQWREIPEEVIVPIPGEQKTKFTIAFDLNKGTGEFQEIVVEEGTTIMLPKGEPTRDGYAFAGWVNESGKKLKSGATLKNIAANQTLKAKWKANTYQVVFYKNGGKGSMKELSFTYGKSQKLTANAFTKTGYYLSGWNTKKDGSGKSIKNKASVKNLTTKNLGTVKLYAQWKPITYKVKFVANGGKGSMKTQTLTYNKKTKLTKNTFKRTGYTFKGWATSKSKASKGKVTYKNAATAYKLTTKKGATITLYAVWKKK